MEAEAQLELMETTLARLNIETKSKSFEIKELDQQKNSLNLELQSLISKNFSEDGIYFVISFSTHISLLLWLSF